MRASEKVWWTAVEIRAAISDRWGRDVPQTSISPKLSKMKDAGKIVRDGMKIALPERAPKEKDLLDPPENEGGTESSEAKAESDTNAFGLHKPQSSPPEAQD